MKITNFLILQLLLMQQIALADTAKLHHLPDGATTILTPTGEDLGILFQLKSVLLNGEPIQLSKQPHIKESQLGYTIQWDDAITEHWLDIDSDLSYKKMELVININQINDREQNLVIEYFFDPVSENTIFVDGYSIHHINEIWSLGTNGMWIRGNECALTSSSHETKSKIHRFNTRIKPGQTRIHLGIEVQLLDRRIKSGNSKPWPNRFYLSEDQLIVSDHNGYLSYFSRKVGVFKFKQKLEQSNQSLTKSNFGCQVHLGNQQLVVSDCAAGKLFFYQNIKQLWQPTGETNNRFDTSNTGGYHWSGQYLDAHDNLVYSETESFINSFSYQNNHWSLNQVFDVASELKHGSLEAFVIDDDLMVVMTKTANYTYHIHLFQRQNSNWVLSDETVLFEKDSGFASEQLLLTEDLLAIPMDSDEPKVWLFDLTKKLNKQNPFKLENMAGTSPKQHFDRTGFGQAIANSGDWVYVLSGSRQERSDFLNETMPVSQCQTDTWGRVDAWHREGELWKHTGFIPTKLSQYGTYDLIQDQNQVYMVQGQPGSSQYQLIPIVRGKAMYEDSYLVTGQ